MNDDMKYNKLLIELYLRSDELLDRPAREEPEELGEIERLQAEIEVMLPNCEHSRLIRLMDLMFMLHSEAEEQAFINGFSMGLQLMMAGVAAPIDQKKLERLLKMYKT